MSSPAGSVPSVARLAAPRWRAWRLAIVTAALYMALDQLTKQLVVHSIARGEHRSVFFGIDLTNVRNRGVAFGVLSGDGTAVTVLTLSAVTLLIVFFALRASIPTLWLPVGVIVGGALGNLADRARLGAVVDFIDPHIWPAFNLADAGIVVGVIGLFYVIEASR
jgi:signal peptidase II